MVKNIITTKNTKNPQRTQIHSELCENLCVPCGKNTETTKTH